MSAPPVPHVLVVDDEAAIRSTLDQLLTYERYRVLAMLCLLSGQPLVCKDVQ